MSVSIHRFRAARRGNETLDDALSAIEQSAMISSAASKLEELFDTLQIDHRNDHNMQNTPQRVAKMLVTEIMKGRYSAPPEITEFENAQKFDQLLITGPIEVRSTCAHHLMPIYGQAYVGVLPSAEGKIIGLSKYDRIVDYFASRLQIQEEMVKQIGHYIVAKTAPKGLAVRLSAVHMCKTHRGVRASHQGRMVTTAYFGAMASDPQLKQAFLQECIGLERGL